MVIEIPGLTVSEEMKKKISTQSLNLATSSIDILSNGSGVKIVLDQTGLWEHSMTQTDKKVIS